jgi:hypothetical protein
LALDKSRPIDPHGILLDIKYKYKAKRACVDKYLHRPNVYPQTPSELKRVFPTLYDAAFEHADPFPCPYGESEIHSMTGMVPLRRSNACLRQRAQQPSLMNNIAAATAAATQPNGLSMLQMVQLLQAMQQGTRQTDDNALRGLQVLGDCREHLIDNIVKHPFTSRWIDRSIDRSKP